MVREFEWSGKGHGKGKGKIFFGKVGEVRENEKLLHQMSDFQAKMHQFTVNLPISAGAFSYITVVTLSGLINCTLCSVSKHILLTFLLI